MSNIAKIKSLFCRIHGHGFFPYNYTAPIAEELQVSPNRVAQIAMGRNFNQQIAERLVDLLESELDLEQPDFSPDRSCDNWTFRQISEQGRFPRQTDVLVADRIGKNPGSVRRYLSNVRNGRDINNSEHDWEQHVRDVVADNAELRIIGRLENIISNG